jgi:hypothetical protein
MKIKKTVVTLIDLDALGQTLDVDTIEYEGKLWLVPEWNDTIDGTVTMPARLICLAGLPLEKNTSGGVADYVLQHPMTKAILNGQIPPELANKVAVVHDPNIQIQRGGGKAFQ